MDKLDETGMPETDAETLIRMRHKLAEILEMATALDHPRIAKVARLLDEEAQKTLRLKTM